MRNTLLLKIFEFSMGNHNVTGRDRAVVSDR